jgi:predicted N-acetyltransferase YhbS
MRAAKRASTVRPMTEADIPQVATVTAEAFTTDISTARVRSNWEHRLRHSLQTDPGGSFVSERAGAVTGAAQAVIRDRVWILSLMAVSPTLGVGGEGRALMDASLGYDGGTEGGLIIASDDPRALRLYASSGFALEPTFKASGTVDPALIPTLDPAITLVDPEQLSLLAPISRVARGAAHTPDLEVPRFAGASFYRLEGRGFVATYPGRGIWMLAAADEQAAIALFWHGLAQLQQEPQVDIGWIGGRQRWALDVCVAARLSFSTFGAIGTRGAVGPLHPYIPSPPFA